MPYSIFKRVQAILEQIEHLEHRLNDLYKKNPDGPSPRAWIQIRTKLQNLKYQMKQQSDCSKQSRLH